MKLVKDMQTNCHWNYLAGDGLLLQLDQLLIHRPLLFAFQDGFLQTKQVSLRRHEETGKTYVKEDSCVLFIFHLDGHAFDDKMPTRYVLATLLSHKVSLHEDGSTVVLLLEEGRHQTHSLSNVRPTLLVAFEGVVPLMRDAFEVTIILEERLAGCECEVTLFNVFGKSNEKMLASLVFTIATALIIIFVNSFEIANRIEFKLLLLGLDIFILIVGIFHLRTGGHEMHRLVAGVDLLRLIEHLLDGQVPVGLVFVVGTLCLGIVLHLDIRTGLAQFGLQFLHQLRIAHHLGFDNLGIECILFSIGKWLGSFYN